MWVPLPPRSHQVLVADTLRPLEQQIVVLHRMNQALEDMAQALFRSWFVDFEPVQAKAEGRHPKGMESETSALFPSRLVKSEMGEIPEGWKALPLDQIATFRNGLALQKYPPVDDRNLPVIKIAQLRRGSADDADLASADVPAEYVVRDGDILFSWSGSLLVSMWAGGAGALNQHLFKVTSASYPKWFYFLSCRNHLPEFQRIAQAKATTMGHIQRHHLTDALVAVPTAQLLKAANQLFEPLLGRWLSNALEARTLAQLRDSLLPKILSGEIQVRDAEAKLAAQA
ncbi:restriction endonuclease subunit S [Corallococcus interemptor]|uniref:Restriction endonuclease subunit S n=2 Tax=Corallococcus interemptor TaxID=2316720 RepID=A0A3A8R5L6_9BACT|nr:restriction endonuclease subunit S [Corallococcus interemptor]